MDSQIAGYPPAKGSPTRDAQDLPGELGPHRAWSTNHSWSSNTAPQWPQAQQEGDTEHPTAQHLGTCSDSGAGRMLELQVWLLCLPLFEREPSPVGGFVLVCEERLLLLSCSLAHSALLKLSEHICPPG